MPEFALTTEFLFIALPQFGHFTAKIHMFSQEHNAMFKLKLQNIFIRYC